MAKYHINPETGNPNLCRAVVKCPYGGADAHHSSKEAARAAYEEEASQSVLVHLKASKLSQGTKLILELDRVQQFIIREGRQADGRMRNEHWSKATWNARIRERDNLRDRLRDDLPWDDTDAPTYDDTMLIPFVTRTFSGSEDRQGYSNDSFSTTPEEEVVYSELDRAGSEWVKRLSTAEVKAVARYNADAARYAELTGGTMHGPPTEDEEKFVKYFHSALAKAPRTEAPFRVYAGISEKRVLGVRAQGETGAITLDRVQSGSANPAQVNGFMYPSDWKSDGDETAVEFELTRAASLSAFNIHRGEMELLVPPGSYTVKEKHRGITYYWGGARDGKAPSGRTAETTYVVSGL